MKDIPKDDILFENESFRVRKSTEEEKKEFEKHKDEDIKIKYKELELSLCGFTTAKNQKGKLSQQFLHTIL